MVHTPWTPPPSTPSSVGKAQADARASDGPGLGNPVILAQLEHDLGIRRLPLQRCEVLRLLREEFLHSRRHDDAHCPHRFVGVSDPKPPETGRVVPGGLERCRSRASLGSVRFWHRDHSGSLCSPGARAGQRGHPGTDDRRASWAYRAAACGRLSGIHPPPSPQRSASPGIKRRSRHGCPANPARPGHLRRIHSRSSLESQPVSEVDHASSLRAADQGSTEFVIAKRRGADLGRTAALERD